MERFIKQKGPALSKGNESKGFTLIELLVAITIFIVAMTSASAIFIAVIRSQQKNNAQRQTSQDARYAMEAITREVRMATGDATEPAIAVDGNSNWTTAPAGLDKKLTIITSDESSPCTPIKKEFYVKADHILYLKDENNLSGTPITSSNLQVTAFKLKNYIVYTTNPGRQPSITITITTAGGQSVQASQTTLRTTISSRDYQYAQ